MAEVPVANVVPYNRCGSTNRALPKVRINLYGIDNLRFVGQKLWQILQRKLKESQKLEISNKNIKAKPPDCSYK